MVEGVILAGGKSSRMKENKMMKIYLDQPLIYHAVNAMLDICDFVTIVTGHYDEDYLRLFDHDVRIKLVFNPNYENGMFSSVQAGVSSINNDVFIIPGDYPLVKAETYKKMLLEIGELRVPKYKEKKGHPIFISKQLLKDLKNEPIESNLKVFRDRYKVNYIDVDDPGVLIDIDNIEDYSRLVETGGLV
jgi:molybdenum cofactor cytidylyltransferase